MRVKFSRERYRGERGIGFGFNRWAFGFDFWFYLRIGITHVNREGTITSSRIFVDEHWRLTVKTR